MVAQKTASTATKNQKSPTGGHTGHFITKKLGKYRKYLPLLLIYSFRFRFAFSPTLPSLDLLT